jgi:penicillin-binding protein 2
MAGKPGAVQSGLGSARCVVEHGCAWLLANKRLARNVRWAQNAARSCRSPGSSVNHALFGCFVPYREPAYAISVVAEHGEGGAKVAAPIARDIMRKALEIEWHRPGPPVPQVANFTVDS